MNKLFLLLSLFVMGQHAYAVEPPDTVNLVIPPPNDDDTPIPPPPPKTPIYTPVVCIENGFFYFEETHPEYGLSLWKNDEEVFSSIVIENLESLEIPSSISGDCEIRLVCNGIVFYGNIIL